MNVKRAWPERLPAVALEEDEAVQWISALRWPNGPVCPYCGSLRVYSFADARTSKCADCRKRFSAKVGTVFQDSNLPWKKWLHAAWLISCAEVIPSTAFVANALCVTQKTAGRMMDHLERVMTSPSFKAEHRRSMAKEPGDMPAEFLAIVEASVLARREELNDSAGNAHDRAVGLSDNPEAGGPPSRRQSTNVRDRIFEAARIEVATYGPTRARIDRIVTMANTSKERLYAYFEDKDALIKAVVRDRIKRTDTETTFDVADLVDFTGELFDFYTSQPDAVRLAYWLSLEDAGDEFDDIRAQRARKRIALMQEAQRAGLIDPFWEPATLLNILANMASTWATAPTFMRKYVAPDTDGDLTAWRREQVMEAVRRIITPTADSAQRSDMSR